MKKVSIRVISIRYGQKIKLANDERIVNIGDNGMGLRAYIEKQELL